MNFKTYIIIFFLFNILGCSRLSFIGYYDQSAPPVWKSTNNGPYSEFFFECDSFYISLSTDFRYLWKVAGPPLIPIIPFPLKFDGGEFSFSLTVDSKYKRQIYELPEFFLKVQGGDSLLNQKESEIITRQPFSCIYYFSVDNYSRDTLQIVFPKQYLGCDLPTIKFVAASETHYEPFIVPIGI